MVVFREYFKEVSFEAETIVATIETPRVSIFKKNRNMVGSGLRFRVSIATLIETLIRNPETTRFRFF